jgi:hypothetical protein
VVEQAEADGQEPCHERWSKKSPTIGNGDGPLGEQRDTGDKIEQASMS